MKSVIKYTFMKKIISYLVFVVACLFSNIGYGQENISPTISFDTINFEHLSIEHGLSQSTVYCIFQDRDGFMWFGTERGLNRFDGYTFTHFIHDPADSCSLSNNFVLTIAEDKNGVLWIGTWGGGVNKFDKNKEKFIHYLNIPDDPNSLSDNNIRDIFEDSSGSLWIGTDNGLNKLVQNENNRSSATFIRYQKVQTNPESISSNQVRSICEDRFGTLWVGTYNGLNKLIPNEDDELTVRFEHFFNNTEDPNSISHNRIYTLFKNKAGTIWVGTMGGGLNKLIQDDKTSTPYFVRFGNDPNNPYSLSRNNIYSIQDDNSGFLWVGTDNKLNKFDEDKSGILHNKFLHYQNDPANPTSLSNNVIFSIFKDRSGVIWIGTFGGGINKIVPNKNGGNSGFVHYKSDPNYPDGLNHNFISSIYIDKKDFLWIGTDGGGLNKQIQSEVNDNSSEYRHYLTSSGLGGNHIYSIFEDKNSVFWIGTWNGGLDKIIPIDGDDNNFTFLHYRNDPDNVNSLSQNKIVSIVEAQNENELWIGTWGGGLNKFNPATEQFIHFKHNPNDPNSLSNDRVQALYRSALRPSELWIGTYGGGLNKLIVNQQMEDTPEFLIFKNSPDNMNSISSNIVRSIYEDLTGTLWIGTEQGLNKLDFKERNAISPKFIRYTEKDGLPNSVVQGILEDEDGFLWLSTNNGLSKFDPNTESFINFDTNDGLQSNEFSLACYKSPSGRMYFGGINGYNAFYPDSIQVNTQIPSIKFTNLKLLNKSINVGDVVNGRTILNKSITVTDTIRLSYKDYIFSLQFAALDYMSPEKNQYKYKLEGLNKEWIHIKERNFIAFTNLNSGKHTLRILGSNNHNVWNEEGLTLTIFVSTPFWQSWWFRGFAICSIFIIAGSIFHARIKSVEEKKKILQMQVLEKTKAAKELHKALTEVKSLKNRLYAENIYLQDEIKVEHNFENIICNSEVFKRVLRKVEQVASTDSTVLIQGESGTGKELIARAIHNISSRKDRPLVKVDCSTLPSQLIESELFGHEKGSFTGAIARKIGRFELADKGTIFLDEIGEMPVDLQVKLLRILQDGEFERLGGTDLLKVDVRILAATNRNLKDEMKLGNFRKDLFYRLNVFPILIPPLRERKEDVPLLTDYFVKKFNAKISKKVKVIPQSILTTLMEYQWPGNVRELQNVLERAVIITPGEKLVFDDWFQESHSDSTIVAIKSLEESEKENIIKALKLTGWRVSGNNGAAKILGINPKTLYSRMTKLKIQREST